MASKKKGMADIRADGAFRRLAPRHLANSDSRAFYACARKEFDTLLGKLTVEETDTLRIMLDCLADSIREEKASNG